MAKTKAEKPQNIDDILFKCRYIQFVDRDSNIDYDATLKETSKAVSELLKAHETNTAKIKAAFEGLEYE